MPLLRELFAKDGLHVVCDGQYGSTGKGVLAAWLAEQAARQDLYFFGTINNAGPNSGHTSYYRGEKIVLKQLPTFAVISHLLGKTHPIYLSAGAIIDPEILRKEAEQFPGINIFVHPNAAVITAEDKEAEHSGTVAAVAGTRSGTGAALARKVLRDPAAVWGAVGATYSMPLNVFTGPVTVDIWKRRVFMEISQGFSLGLNQQFYPKTTSRECTVAQGVADAGLPPRCVAKTYMSCRTYPIRVGNVDGFSSGDWYWDQRETNWDALGVPPELTTVTQRVRRVATFSEQQFRDAVKANDPDFVFLNFMNYMDDKEQMALISRINGINSECPHMFSLIRGYGPTSDDVMCNVG